MDGSLLVVVLGVIGKGIRKGREKAMAILGWKNQGVRMDGGKRVFRPWHHLFPMAIFRFSDLLKSEDRLMLQLEFSDWPNQDWAWISKKKKIRPKPSPLGQAWIRVWPSPAWLGSSPMVVNCFFSGNGLASRLTVSPHFHNANHRSP